MKIGYTKAVSVRLALNDREVEVGGRDLLSGDGWCRDAALAAVALSGDTVRDAVGRGYALRMKVVITVSVPGIDEVEVVAERFLPAVKDRAVADKEIGRFVFEALTTVDARLSRERCDRLDAMTEAKGEGS